MRGLIKVTRILGILLFTFAGAAAKPTPSPGDDPAFIVIVFNDGHRQSFVMAEIARIDFKAPSVIVSKTATRRRSSPTTSPALSSRPPWSGR